MIFGEVFFSKEERGGGAIEALLSERGIRAKPGDCSGGRREGGREKGREERGREGRREREH